MPKPITQRGFNIRKGDCLSETPGKAMISYEIDNNGLENILLVRGVDEFKVYIVVDDGEVKSLDYGSSQIPTKMIMEKDALQHEEELRQAKDIYEEVKRVLNVDEELKKYCPRFSHPSEASLYNILGIDDASQIKSLIEEGAT
jgi:hypothetical protein